MSDQQPQHTKEEFAELIEKQRKRRELIAEFNAEFSRPGAWTVLPRSVLGHRFDNASSDPVAAEFFADADEKP
jgi:hypothetical protein